jgi:hypothetical protein
MQAKVDESGSAVHFVTLDERRFLANRQAPRIENYCEQAGFKLNEAQQIPSVFRAPARRSFKIKQIIWNIFNEMPPIRPHANLQTSSYLLRRGQKIPKINLYV